MREIKPSKFPELINIRDGSLPEKVCLIIAKEWSVDPTKDPEKHLFDPLLPSRNLDLSEFEMLEKLSKEGYERPLPRVMPFRDEESADRMTFWYTNVFDYPQEPKAVQLVYEGGWELKDIVYEKRVLGKWKKFKPEDTDWLSLDRYDELRNIAQNHYQIGSRDYIRGEPGHGVISGRSVELPPTHKFEERFWDSANDRAIHFFYEKE